MNSKELKLNKINILMHQNLSFDIKAQYNQNNNAPIQLVSPLRNKITNLSLDFSQSKDMRKNKSIQFHVKTNINILKNESEK